MTVVSSAIVFIAAISLVSCTFLNPYPRFRVATESANAGDALKLSQFIARNDTASAKRAARVTGASIDSIESYSGFLTADNSTGSHLFFWYFPIVSQSRDPRPLLVWLEGGPGYSSAAYSVLYHNGPFQYDDNQRVAPRKISWHSNYNVLYLDCQVGSGYSYSEVNRGYPRTQRQIAQHLFEVLRQFFVIFPEVSRNKMFIGGESLAGRYAIALAIRIQRSFLEPSVLTKMNLKGLILGSTLVDPMHQMNYGEYFFNLGLIDQNGRNEFKKIEDLGLSFIKNHSYVQALDTFDNLLSVERTKRSLFSNLTGHASLVNYQKPARNDVNEQLGRFLQSATFRRAIHVGNQRYQNAQRDNVAEQRLNGQLMTSSTQWLANLPPLFRVLVYSGQYDLLVPYPLTSHALHKFKYDERDKFRNSRRVIWKKGKEIYGYAREGGNICEVLIKDVGHFAVADKPANVIDMLLRFTDEYGFSRDI